MALRRLGRNLCFVAGLATHARATTCLAVSALSLDGKTALVFGGTSGIGLAAAIRLREEGARVVAISRNPEKASIEAERHNISLVAGDVRDRISLARVFKDHDPVDIIVAAATGGKRAMGPFLEMDMDAYQASFDKLWGYANIVRVGAPHMPMDGASSIVLVSGAPARKPRPGQISLASVGAAVEQFARSLAPELAPRRINVVSPGIIATPMFGAPSAARAAQLASATETNLIARAGLPEEVAAAIMFLVQNQFATGTTVDVDGGWLAGPRG
jgi:NAD(P)-dependent dehydrogenase (short-subunit alcohol dehydrogenase family)